MVTSSLWAHQICPPVGDMKSMAVGFPSLLGEGQESIMARQPRPLNILLAELVRTAISDN